MERRRGFTLVELLVVISVIGMLMALLLPGLGRVRRQAQAVACQGRLRQLGQLAAMYAHDSPGEARQRLPDGVVVTSDGIGVWRIFLRTHRIVDTKLRLCPSAAKPLEGDPLPWGDTFRAYALGRVSPQAPPEERDVLGYASIGMNRWMDSHAGGDLWEGQGWRSTDVRGASSIPVFFDSTTLEVRPYHLDPPREFRSYHQHVEFCGYGSVPMWTMSPVCIDRHGGGINIVFMDWAVRKVGMKELWTLRWHPEYDTTGPWTKAGGVLPGDWPQWMRKFKDY